MNTACPYCRASITWVIDPTTRRWKALTATGALHVCTTGVKTLLTPYGRIKRAA